MELHDKLEKAVILAAPKSAPDITFNSDLAPSFVGGVVGMPVATTVLHVTFGKGKDAITIPCGLTGAETDSDLDQYAQNIIAAWKGAK